MIPNFKTGWVLIKTTKQKPSGYKGYTFSLYNEDDITILKELKAKTASKIWYKIVKLYQEDKNVT